MASHVKSKRIPAKQKYKVAKKVREHHRKVRKELKKRGGVQKKSKDPGIPNSWPFKQELMEQIAKKKEEEKERKREERLKRREARRAGVSSLESLGENARKRDDEFEGGDDGAQEREMVDSGIENEGSRKAYMKELRKLIEAADVVLQVLDARDPMGCRCFEAERMIMEAEGASKRMIFVLNKVDLVPKEVAQKWLTFLRNEFPAVAFRAALQGQKTFSQTKANAINAGEIKTSAALGADTLIQLLKNYSRNRKMKLSCCVGVIGYPNVGKSSLINSLKRTRVVTVGATPGVTKTLQEVQLDKKLRLLDSPGVVFSSKQSSALVLRNCIKIENLKDPITPVEVILKRCGAEPIMAAYAIPQFSDVTECLALVAKKRGKVRKGGSLDTDNAARILLQDWNSGKIAFCTLPPKGAKSDPASARIVTEWSKEFNLDEVLDAEKNDLSSMEVTDAPDFAVVEATNREEMEDTDDLKLHSVDANDDSDGGNADDDEDLASEERDESMQSNGEESDDDADEARYVASHVLPRKRKGGLSAGSSRPAINQRLNPQVNQLRKRELKSERKQARKKAIVSAMAVDKSDENAYDFSVLDDDMAVN
eukprot:Plantae.Rhodophyta-Purpureofilum_apyrenoidigerum.ctg6077.p1 GENE.Plantae.Rhodophyta-Purpureofilum_apyrenoidigerum.ctg6077~~Plantae.Rhodophyta-Purpureofilum_apyrenoidigerum.ctg6077.p1  ORF type:complete len:595 (+),score=162.24 Plantae.Rhodophyta-Purpureofilum_apyrenoidigerum.ctg6077:85-1869(+)